VKTGHNTKAGGQIGCLSYDRALRYSKSSGEPQKVLLHSRGEVITDWPFKRSAWLQCKEQFGRAQAS
jgi:hypothetical protein